MNLNHRLADHRTAHPASFIAQLITYPFGYLIPFILLSLCIWVIRPYVGEGWNTGSLSVVFLPFIGNFLRQVLTPEDNVILSVIILVFFALGPVSLYMYVLYITRRHLAAIIAGLVAILPLSPFSQNPSERLLLAITEGDGAHIMGLTLIPLLAITYHLYLRTGKNNWQMISLFGGVVLGLISFFAYTISLIFLFYISCSEALVAEGRVKLRRFLISSIIQLGVFTVVYNLSLFTMLTSDAGQSTIKVLLNLIPLTFFLVPVLGTFAFLIFDRRPQLQPLFLGLMFTITFGILHLVRVSLHEVTLFDQSRYAAEVSFSVSFLYGILGIWIFEFVRRGKLPIRTPITEKQRLLVGYGFVGLVIVVLLTSLFFIERSI